MLETFEVCCHGKRGGFRFHLALPILMLLQLARWRVHPHLALPLISNHILTLVTESQYEARPIVCCSNHAALICQRVSCFANGEYISADHSVLVDLLGVVLSGEVLQVTHIKTLCFTQLSMTEAED